MLFKIFSEMFRYFPDLHIGIVIARNINNGGSDKKLFRLLNEVEELIRMDFTPEKMVSLAVMKKHLGKHKLISPWRAAYEDFGYRPEHFHTNVEGLMHTILSGKSIPRKNKLSDCINYTALKHMLPIGGHDLDKVQGDIFLSLATGEERFHHASIHAPMEGFADENEIIYSDAAGALSRRWNSLLSSRTAITEKTKNAFIHIEGLPPVAREQVEDVCKELTETISLFCNGTLSYHVLSSDMQQVNIE